MENAQRTSQVQQDYNMVSRRKSGGGRITKLITEMNEQE